MKGRVCVYARPFLFSRLVGAVFREDWFLRSPLFEDRGGGAGVGGEPVEVFLGEGFGRASGGVDDADGVFAA